MTDTNEDWARGLTEQQLANGLRNLVESIRSDNAVQFRAMAHEAARRIEATDTDSQFAEHGTSATDPVTSRCPHCGYIDTRMVFETDGDLALECDHCEGRWPFRVAPADNPASVNLPATSAAPKTFTMLDLSTAHLPENLARSLDSVAGLIANERGFGWLLWVPDNIDEHAAEYEAEDPEHPIPEVVVTIWRYAAKHGCQYVLLDRDADLNPDLPAYEW